MNQSLREWIESNRPKEEMLWKDAFWEQISFMRSCVGALLAHNGEEYRELVQVVGTHTSKSIVCPIYYIHLEKEKIDIWMRYNFYNWNVTIHSRLKAIDCDFLGVVDDRNYGYCFCEGMEQWKEGPMSNSKFKFTVHISNHYECYVFFRVLRKHLGIKLDEEP